MNDELQNEIINIAISLAEVKKSEYEEPVKVYNLDSNRLYDVVFPYPGTSDPDISRDPPDFTIRVDIVAMTAELVPKI